MRDAGGGSSGSHPHVIAADDVQTERVLLHTHICREHPLEALLEDHVERLVEACARGGGMGGGQPQAVIRAHSCADAHLSGNQ